MGLLDEIHEQPTALGRLLARQAELDRIAAELRARPIDFAYIVARGSSDNAGLYAKYLLGAANGMPVALAVPSLFTMYHAPPRLGKALVIAISQSGQSADIVEAVREARRQGAPTLAITNSATSPLAEAAEYVLDVSAGEERSVAATKSYTAQLLAIAMLSCALAPATASRDALETVPDLVERALEAGASMPSATERYRYMEQCVVIGRGYNYATAFEWSLKLKELCYVLAEPYSSADFRHGPIAIVERGYPILMIVASGAVQEDVLGLAEQLRSEREAEILVVTNVPRAAAIGTGSFVIPEVPEWLSPLVSIIPAQLFTYHLTRTKGLDPDHPRGLRKVTSTE